MMRKTLMMIMVVSFFLIGAQSLQAQEVVWYVGSDYNSCSTYFTVGLHSQTVVITRLRVDNNLNPLDVEEDYVTFTRTEHYVRLTPCPNRRYIYRIYTDVGGVRTLASNQAYIIRAEDNLDPWLACAACNEEHQTTKE